MIGKNFSVNRQSDAHEFLIYLLDKLEECSNLVSKLSGNPKENLVGRIFEFTVKQTVQCSTCLKSSNTFPKYRDLELVSI